MAENGTDMTDGPHGAEAESSGSGIPEMKPAGYFEGETMTRRTVFSVGGQVLGGAAGLLIIGPALLFSTAPIFDSPEETWEAVGDAARFTADTYRPVVITIVAGIGEAGKTTVYVRQGDPETYDYESADDHIAVSTRCAHLGCPVRFVQAAGNFICPCHGGVYDFEGKVIGGPPVRPLDRFQTRVGTDGQVEIGPRYSVTGDLDPVRARDPGEFTGGIWEYLFPPRPSTAPPPPG